MKKIGLLSDTHGYLDPKVFKLFADCDEIWHAGDFGDEKFRRTFCFQTIQRSIWKY
ncbi:MAG: hypothetical protein IPH33_05505 [Bacteroidetes bacterium]|nr:hypothetical protein [Bacteroidota bacterium]